MSAYLTHRPAAGRITEAFGPRPKPTPTSPATHYGLDYGNGSGSLIRAARSGFVTGYSSSGSYGNRLIVDHGAGRQTWYCHLAALSAGVLRGDYVEGGQIVALMGATGNVTAKHLHFELRIDGVAVDPAPYFIDTAATDITPTTPKDIPMHALIADDRGLFMVLLADGSTRRITSDAQVRFWSKVCANQRGTDSYAAVNVSGEEWEAAGL